MSAIKMDAEHSNTLVSEFLKRLSRSTLTPFAKADLVDLATHLGWSKTEKVPKKAELRGIVERLALSARLQELVKVSEARVVPELGDLTLSFEQYLELEREKAKIEKERLHFELEHEKLKVEVTLERERVKVEQLKLELIKEGKANESLITSGRRGSTSWDVAESLQLLPKFDERDPDTFFTLFERVAVERR